jgi:hypothetical protein
LLSAQSPRPNGFGRARVALPVFLPPTPVRRKTKRDSHAAREPTPAFGRVSRMDAASAWASDAACARDREWDWEPALRKKAADQSEFRSFPPNRRTGATSRFRWIDTRKWLPDTLESRRERVFPAIGLVEQQPSRS